MDQAKVEALAAAERKWFRDGRPRSMEATSRATGTMPRGVPMSWMDELYDHPPLWVSHGAGSRFWDLDGHEYVDMYVADMEVATGGTLFANALSMAAARAALTEVLTPEAFITTARLGHQLAAGGPSPRSIAWRSPMMRWASSTVGAGPAGRNRRTSGSVTIASHGSASRASKVRMTRRAVSSRVLTTRS